MLPLNTLVFLYHIKKAAYLYFYFPMFSPTSLLKIFPI
ncbi:hypothetical protein CU008_1446 [Enterococcus faecium]|nr:hypothetical protein [Enterococcus faecium]